MSKRYSNGWSIPRTSQYARIKNRQIPCSTGEVNDALFYASSGTYAGSVSQWTNQAILDSYNNCKKLRATPVSLSSFVGHEKFCSTTAKKPIMNNCEHVRLRMVSYPYAYFAPDYNPFYEWNSGYYAQYRRDNVPAWALGVVKTPKAVDVPDFARARAYWTLQPRFQSDVSMMNFIFELKDFRNITKLLLRPKKLGFDKLHKIWNKDLRSGKLSAYDLTRPAAEARLVYSYAIVPTLKDLAAIGAAIVTLASEAENRFIQQGTTEQKRHYSEVIAEQSSLVSGDYNNYWKANGTHYRVLFNATMRYHYKYIRRSTLSAFAHYWGLTGNAEAFWNMIPFSFLVDYFAGIAKALGRMTTDRNVSLDVDQYCESILVTHTCGAHIGPSPRKARFVLNGRYTESPNQLLSGLEGTYYLRQGRTPYTGFAPPVFKLPSSSQNWNMLALARCFM